MAVDVEKNVEVAKALEKQYRFKLEGVPHVFFLKPQATKGRRRIVYNSARTASALYKEALSHMPGILRLQAQYNF